MASYSRLGWWPFDEASAGTGPPILFDNFASNDMPISYGIAAANWTFNLAGRGLAFTTNLGAAVANITDMTNPLSIGGQLNGDTEASLIAAVKIFPNTLFTERICQLGRPSTDGEITIAANATQLVCRFGGSNANTYNYAFFGVYAVLGVVYDTTEAFVGDRCKLFVNGALQAPVLSTILNGDTLSTNFVNTSWNWGNRADLTREGNTEIYAGEIGTGKLSTDEINTASAVWLANNDVDWQLAGRAQPSLMGMNF